MEVAFIGYANKHTQLHKQTYTRLDRNARRHIEFDRMEVRTCGYHSPRTNNRPTHNTHAYNHKKHTKINSYLHIVNTHYTDIHTNARIRMHTCIHLDKLKVGLERSRGKVRERESERERKRERQADK